jgi:hypothetical protein
LLTVSALVVESSCVLKRGSVYHLQ